MFFVLIFCLCGIDIISCTSDTEYKDFGITYAKFGVNYEKFIEDYEKIIKGCENFVAEYIKFIVDYTESSFEPDYFEYTEDAGTYNHCENEPQLKFEVSSKNPKEIIPYCKNGKLFFYHV